MINTAQSAKKGLVAASRAKDRARRWATGFIAGGLFLVGVVLVSLLDYWLMLPIGPRWTALVALVSVLAVGFWKLFRLWQRPTELKEAALDVEMARPELGCELSTATEYMTGERHVTHAYEPELVEALQQKAAATVATASIPYSARVRFPAIVAGLAVVLVGGFLAAFPGAWTALKRTVAPWSRASFTQVEVLPGSVEIALGQSLSVTNRFKGRPVTTAQFQWREAEQRDWETATLVPDASSAEAGRFIHVISAVTRSMTYRVSGGDTVSEEFQLTVYVPPAAKQLTLRLTPPAYTRLPMLEQTAADATVVRGTRAELSVVPNVMLSKARVRLTNDVLIELKSVGTNGVWGAEFTADGDMDYTIELVDLKGRTGTSLKHHITALPDTVPKLDVVEPGQDLRAGPTDSISMKISGSDDFGIQAVRLVYHKLGQPERHLVLPVLSSTNHEFEVATVLPLKELGLSEYELVAYHAEATDNNSLDGPGVGRSPVYFIEITNEGGEPKPKPKPKPGEKVNLLTVQKQILSDTTALGTGSTKESFSELFKRQQDAVEFGRLYEETLMKSGAPVTAQADLHQALQSMEAAARGLEVADRSLALPSEEAALAGLYQVLKSLAELAKAPPPTIEKPSEAQQKPEKPTLNVVLQAIQKKKPEQANQPEMKELLEAMKELRDQQAAVCSQCQNPGDGPSATASASSGSPTQPPNGPQQPPTGSSEPKPKSPPSAQAPSQVKAGDRPPGGSQKSEAEQAATVQTPSETQPTGTPSDKGNTSKPSQAKSGKGKPGVQPGKGKGTATAKGNDPSTQSMPGNGSQPGKGSGKSPGTGRPSDSGQPPELAGTAEPEGSKPPSPSDPKPPGNLSPKPESTQAKQSPKTEPSATPLVPMPMDQLAAKQESLSQEAKALSERLNRLAGKGVRAGHGISRHMSQAAQQMDRATKAMRQGNAQSASGAGDQGSAAMNSAIALMERTIAGQPELTDVATEEAPKQYEGAISDYFKRLTRAQ